jgi:hypothetical protein
MLPTRDSGNLSSEDRGELTGIKVAPLAAARIVARTRFAALGARQLALGIGKQDGHFSVRGGKLDVLDAPGTLNAEDLAVQIAVSHGF